MKSGLAVTLLSVACLFFGTGCGKSHNTAAAVIDPTIRLANDTQAATLTMNGVGVTDATQTFTTAAIGPGGASTYATVTPQTYTLGVGSSDGSLTASTQSLGLAANTNYTMLAYARGGAINTYTILDNQVVPASGFAQVLVANAGGDAGPLDVYLVSSNTNLNGVAPVFVGVAAKSTATGKAITAGTYDIVVTGNGKPSDIRLLLPAITFNSTDIVTIALTSTVGGGLVDGALVKQGGTIQLEPSTVARVRVAGAFPPVGTPPNSTNSTVDVSIGGTALATLTAPAVGAYKLISGNSSTYTVSVNGTPVTSLPTATFVNGGDYTVLVTGTPASPIVSVLQDDNQPSSSGFANIRLVNAAVAGGITLEDNFVPVDSDIAFGQASDYGPATPLSTSLLQITSPVANFAGYTANNVNIVGGSVYTIFVLGSASAPVVSLAKDR